MRRWAALIAVVAGCAEDVPEPPATLVMGIELPVPFNPAFFTLAFDPRDSLVMSDTVRLVRVTATGTTSLIGTEQLATNPEFGFDSDGELLVGGQVPALFRLTGDDALVQLGPAPPALPFFAPVGTPAGNHHIDVRAPFGPHVLVPGGTAWDPGPDMRRTLRAPDGTLFAIRDGGIVRFAADDSTTVITGCAFAGLDCGLLALAGFDAADRLYVAEPDATEIRAIDLAGTVETIDLPSELVVVDVRATAQVVAVLAKNPLRENELTLWMIVDGELQRVAPVSESFDGFPNRLVADHAGAMYVQHAHRLDVVFLTR
jgi:hypothetical protein